MLKRLDVMVERIATGFAFTEGPVWLPDASLIFSDIPNNNIRRWIPGGGVTVWRDRSGCDDDRSTSRNRGSNGLTLDREGRVVICEHGNRRVTRLEPDGSLTVLASHYNGRRLNSPNDVVVDSKGAVYFTDPPYGMDGQDDDPAKEQPHNGVYRLAPNGTLQLLTGDLPRPNGLAFSPGEEFLYVSNSERYRMRWMRYPVLPDGTVGGGELFFDAAPLAPGTPEDGVPDGFRVAPDGRLFCTGPGGILVLSPSGEYLGTAVIPEVTSNCVFAPDGALYVTANTSVYCVRGLL